MAPSSTRQHLPPSCHGVPLPRKDTPKVRFKTQLSKYAVPSAKKDALPRLAAALTDARSALQLDRTGLGDSSSSEASSESSFQSMDDIQKYLTSLREYLSLVQGFTVTAASLMSDAQPPMVTGHDGVANPVATLDASGFTHGSPTNALTQPLIDTAATGVELTSSRSKCLSFCNWRDVLTNTNAYAPNARLEMAQMLLAAGLFLLHDARLRVDAMLADRVTEIPENELKIAYQLHLHAAGVLEACLRSLEMTPQANGADVTDLSAPLTAPSSTGESTTENGDDATSLERWREEQRRANEGSSASVPSAPPLPSSTSEDFAMLNRLPDLANGRFPQVVAWIALAQAQELVILRGISREFVDYSLMAKLSIDVAHRYRNTYVFATRHLPCASTPVADRLQVYCAFKHAYYVAVSTYFQGAACMEKDDARHCVQAIANFKKAATQIQEANRRKADYDTRASKDERDRQFTIKMVYVRAEQIIQRDLEIATRRNDSIYYERIPEPEPQCEPISLVKAVEFPAIEIHALWHDTDINTSVQATDPRVAAAAAAASAPTRSATTQGNTQESGPRKDSCCGSCVIS